MFTDILEKERKELAEEYVRQIRERCYTDDYELDHCNADAILCNLIRDLGFSDVVKEYENVDKEYA